MKLRPRKIQWGLFDGIHKFGTAFANASFRITLKMHIAIGLTLDDGKL